MNASLAILTAFLAAMPSIAQKLDLKLDALAARAKEHTVVDMNAEQLKGLATLGRQKPEKAEKLGHSLEGVESVRVYTFEFEKDGQYSDADLAAVRKQLEAPGWARIVSVKEKNESTEIYMMSRDGKTAGLAVISAEPRELNIINVVGTAGLDQLGELVQSQVKYDLSHLRPAEKSGQAGR